MVNKEIVYISDSSIPSYSADSVHVMKMCQAFSKQGYKVTLLGKRTRNNVQKVFDIHSFYGVDNSFKISLFPFKAFLLSGRLYNAFLPFFSFAPNTIAYTRSIYAAFWYSLFGKSIVFEIHEPFNTKGQWLKNIFQFIVSQGYIKKWIVISSPLRTHLISEFNIDSKEVFIAHDGAEIYRNSGFEEKELGEKFKVGYVGSLYQGKGMEIIIQLSKLMKEVDFHIVGGTGSQIGFWRSQFDEKQKNLIFHGYKAPGESHKFISQFDILLAPYQRQVFVKNSKQANNLSTWMSPLKIFEYMSAGKPIIASDLPVIREILEHNHTALLCDPDYLPDWVASVNRIMESVGFGKNLGDNAKNALETQFTWDIRCKNILEFLKPN
ncbi:glycosyltransferase family 4 protein [Algoriphagus yeomjeoni]|uniref:glycosyltransferase family 4 protein n=1 Tax=Algoriphagus yeomjeoni TaxID=291403 RepID=UPI003CE4C23B